MPILKEGELDIVSHSPEQTHRIGVRLGGLLQAGDVICLSGDLGAGKTVFAAGIGKGWGAKMALTSPTYNLVHVHTRDADTMRLYHLDCYRLRGIDDADSIGLDDMLDGRGVMLVEWAENLDSVLPQERLWIELRAVEHTRRNFTFEATGKRYAELVAHLRDKIFGA